MILPPTWLDCHSVAKWLPSLREMECSPRGLTSIFNNVETFTSPVSAWGKERAQSIDVQQRRSDSLDVEIYYVVLNRGPESNRCRKYNLSTAFFFLTLRTPF